MEKFQHVRAFTTAASEHVKHPSETTASVIQRNLSIISASQDISIFDSTSNVGAMFYATLHDLMNISGSKSNFIWTAVDVLQVACKNSTTRHALIHTYKFAPILSKLLEANLTSEKRIKALKILQELTYGIRILWQEAHLPHLISTLSQWVTQSNEEEVIILSLGVLVNLCYKNLPAVYALMRCVNTKTFLQSVVKTRNHNVSIRVQCCKLLIILEHTNSDILDSYILDVAGVTFSSIIPTLKLEDTHLLRHIVDFFDDIKQNDRFRIVLQTYPKYSKDVKNILENLKEVKNYECASLVMEFLLTLVKLKITDLIQLYPQIVKSAVQWIPTEKVGSRALALIRTIIIDSRRTKYNGEVLDELDLSVLPILIKEDDDMDGSHGSRIEETEKNLTELMKLFQELVKTPSIRTKVLEVFSISQMRHLMKPILECNNDSGLLENQRNIFHDPSTEFYVHALALIADLVTSNTLWLTLYTELLQKKRLQMIMAAALFTGDSDVKQKVLQLTSTVGYPQECISAVARCMVDLEPLVMVQDKINITNNSEGITKSHPYDTLPLFSMAQEGRLDSLLLKLEKSLENNQASNTPISAVMELYEYKMASVKHGEMAMQASLEAATNYATSLQHRLAQLGTQSNHLHQVLFNTQQCLEGLQTEKEALLKQLKETEEETRKTHSVQIQEIHGLKKIVLEKDNQITLNINRMKEIPILIDKIKELEAELEELKNKLDDMSNKYQEKSKVLAKMQESFNRKEQIIEEKNREITSNRKDIIALNQEIKQQAQQCLSYQKAIDEKEEMVQKLTNDLSNLSRMRDMIFELTAKKNADLS